MSFGGGALPKHWERNTTAAGQDYYVHKLTGWATYQKPQPLPSGWEMAQDKVKGQVYYWNTKTRETRYLDWLGAPPSMPPSDLQLGYYAGRSKAASLGTAPSKRPSLVGRLSSRLSASQKQWKSFEDDESASMVSDADLPPLPPWLQERAGSSGIEMSGEKSLDRRNVIRLRLNGCADLPFVPAGDIAVVASLPPGSLLAREVQVGDRLVALNNSPVPPKPEDALNMLYRATLAYGSVVIELVRKEAAEQPVAD